MRFVASVVGGGTFALVLAACGGDSGPADSRPTSPDTPSSFGRLQSTVFTPTCAVSGCHVSSSAATSGNLVLTADVAYDNLVGARPSNLAAQRDGYRRVVPFRPDSSLLFQKTVLALVGQHSEYGNVMPVGAQVLSQGQIEFLRQWIEAGAPRAGDVVDATLLSNTTPQTRSTFIPLAPPPAGHGVQIHVDSFGVAAHFERELFVYRPLNNTAPMYVNRIQTSMRDLSHHFVLYSVDPNMARGFPCTPPPNTVRDIRNLDGSLNLFNMIPMACHVFVGGSMTSANDYSFPAGVALMLPATMWLDMNVHYVNRTTAEIPGEAFANLYTVPAAQVQHIAATLNMPNTSFTLPPGVETTSEKTFTVGQTTTIFMLTSHMHMLGTRFQIRISGGPRDKELVYDNRDWAHPQALSFPAPIVLQKGQGLTSIITWNNTTNHAVSFGLQSTDEMGIIFGYYY